MTVTITEARGRDGAKEYFGSVELTTSVYFAPSQLRALVIVSLL